MQVHSDRVRVRLSVMHEFISHDREKCRWQSHEAKVNELMSQWISRRDGGHDILCVTTIGFVKAPRQRLTEPEDGIAYEG